MKQKFLLATVLLSVILTPVIAQPQIELEPFASGFDSPLGIVNAGDERLFVVEQGGLIRIIESNENVLETPFLDLSETLNQTGFERGLLGLAFHPDYSENGYFFVNYTHESDGHTVISRFSVDENNPNLAVRESEQVLLTVEQPFQNHNGGQIQFGPEGYLYIGLGDGGDAGDPGNNAQNPDTLLGKMLRIDVDVEMNDTIRYSIPPDNPFANDDSALDEIWALGLRNPWRFSFDRFTNDLWMADVGQNEYEEINFQPDSNSGGENYGWRCFEGNHPFNQENCLGEEFYTFPVFEYEHEGSGCSGSVTGGYVYRGAKYNGMFGHYIFADYCTGKFYHIVQTNDGFDGELLGTFTPGEYTAFGEDVYGELYIALQNAGEIRKVTESSDCMPVAQIMEDTLNMDTAVIHAFFHPSLEYQWNLNDVPIAGETGASLNITEDGIYTVTVVNPENSCTNTSEPLEVDLNPTAIELNELSRVRIFPNPSSGILHIDGLPGYGNSTISLVDMTGSAVMNKTIGNSRKNFSFSTRSLPSGLYLINISHGDEILRQKIIVK